jgi:hypothetical protein
MRLTDFAPGDFAPGSFAPGSFAPGGFAHSGFAHSGFAHSGRRRRACVFGLAAMAAVSALFLSLTLVAFDSKPGPEAAPPRTLPRDTAITVTAHRAHLLMFVHPQCGCTNASIAQLRRIEALWRPENPDITPDITFVVFRPKNSGMQWNALDDSRRFPASRVLWDEDGVEAKRFRVRTSGTILLYSSGGRLLFSGGITASRGHEGDNYGLTALSERVNAKSPSTAVPFTSRVFGCALTAAPGISGNF